MRILHIEDDASIAQAIARMLRINYGATVVYASSARAAIEILAAADERNTEHDDPSLMFDLIISDFDLEGDNAADVVTWLLVYDPDMLEHFFFLCASARASVIARDFSIPIVQKPASNNEILEMVEQRSLVKRQGKRP